jgi:hypothetical protein
VFQSPLAAVASSLDSGRLAVRDRGRNGQGASPCDGDPDLGALDGEVLTGVVGRRRRKSVEGETGGGADGWSPTVNSGW